MTTLSDGVSTVTIHPDMLWSDEFDWTPVEQSTERTITGSMVVQTATRVAGGREVGRPITLQAPEQSAGWLDRATLDQCRGWAATPGLEMTLVLRGVSHQVIFRHQDKAVESTPVVAFNDVQAGDYYRTTLRFTEV